MQVQLTNCWTCAALTELKISDFAKVLYAYTNSKVDTGLENLGSDFFDWMASSKTDRLTNKRILQHTYKTIKQALMQYGK
jgi:hypothetical protein